MRTIFSTAALVALLCALPSIARAQDDDAEVTKMAKEHYKAGLEAYKAGQYETAIKELKKAYLLKRLPPLLLNIGATYRKMGDNEMALHFYKKYLDEAPPDAKDRPDVEALVKEIEGEKGGAPSAPAQPPSSAPAEATPPPEPAEEAPRKQKQPTEFRHTVVDAAPPDTPLDVRVSMPVMKGVKVYVFYRNAGESDFQQVLMKRHGSEKIGRIPADAMTGKAVQYYIEARDSSGAVVKSSGSQSSPNIVMIDPSAPAQVVASAEPGATQRAQEAAPEESTRERNMDEEEAPILGPSHEGKKRAESSGPSTHGGLFWAGIAVGVAGLAAVGTGVALGVKAKQQADAVTADAKAGQFEFKDPNAVGKDDYAFQNSGKTYDAAGIACDVIGGVFVAAGVTMIAIDVVRHRGAEEKPKHAPRDESSWWIAPSAGQARAGLAGGFSF